MKLKKKLQLSFGLIIIILIVVGFINAFFIIQISQKIREITDERDFTESKIHDAHIDVLSIYGDTLYAFLLEPEERIRAVELLDRKAINFNELINDIFRNPKFSEHDIRNIQNNFQHYYVYAKQIIQGHEFEDIKDKQYLIDTLSTQQESLLKEMNSIVFFVEEEFDLLLANAGVYTNMLLMISFTIIIIGILFSFTGSLFILKSVEKPISILLNNIKNIESDKMDQVVTINSNDEFGILSLAFKRMTERLSNLFSSLREEIENREQAQILTRTLFQISNAVVLCENLPDLYTEIYDSISKVLSLPNFYFGLYNSSGKELDIIFSTNEEECRVGIMKMDRKDKLILARKVIESARPLLVSKEEIENISRKEKLSMSGKECELWLGVPLHIGNDVLGVMVSQSYDHSHQYSKEDIDLLVSVSDQVALAINRKNNEAGIRHLRNFLRNIIDSMPSILVAVDMDGFIIEWNLEAEKRCGVTYSQALGNPIEDLIPLMSSNLHIIKTAIAKNEPQQELRIKTGDESHQKYSDLTVYPLVSDGIQGAVIRIDDISRRIKIEEMMIQSEKMLTVGGLAAGMAHEINNPLAGIIQNLQVVKKRLSPSHIKNIEVAENIGVSMNGVSDYMEKRLVLKSLENIEKSGIHAAEIVKNMLSFSRLSSGNFTQQDLTAVLDRTVEMASSDFNLKNNFDFRKIKIVKEYDRDLPLVSCEKSKLQQVILNLLRNGAQAMFSYEGSKDHPEFTLRVFSGGKSVSIEIQDNGPGLTSEVKNRIFEPFFTTKDSGSGTGLGLSVSYFIISQNHKGSLTVDSELGKGACFKIELPIGAEG